MYSLNNWEKNLNFASRTLLISLSAVLFSLSLWTILTNFRVNRIYNQSISYFEKASKIEKSLATERIVLYRKALRLLNRGIGLDRKDSKFPYQYAQVLIDIAQDRALGALASLLDISQVKTREDLFKLAAAYYQQASSIRPTEANYHLKLGWVYDLLGKEQEAESEFEKTLILDPTNVRNHIYFARYFISKNKEKAAFYHFCKTIYVTRDLPMGPYVADANEFYKKLKKGFYSQIKFKDKETSFYMNEEDFPYPFDFPLDLRIYLTENVDADRNIYIYVTYLPGNKRARFTLKFSGRKEGLLVYELIDIYALAKRYAEQQRLRFERIALAGVAIQDKSKAAIKSIQLVFNH